MSHEIKPRNQFWSVTTQTLAHIDETIPTQYNKPKQRQPLKFTDDLTEAITWEQPLAFSVSATMFTIVHNAPKS